MGLLMPSCVPRSDGHTSTTDWISDCESSVFASSSSELLLWITYSSCFRPGNPRESCSKIDSNDQLSIVKSETIHCIHPGYLKDFGPEFAGIVPSILSKSWMEVLINSPRPYKGSRLRRGASYVLGIVATQSSLDLGAALPNLVSQTKRLG